MKKIKFYFLSLSVLFFIMTAWSQDFISNDYKIQPGDVLTISVLNEEELSRDLRVSADGKINVPLLGEISVLDATSIEISRSVTEKLNLYLVNPQVTVFIASFSKVFVSGEVKKPGAFELSKPLTLMEAITLAGGFSQHANPKKVKLMRKFQGKKFTKIIDISSFINKNETTEQDVLLKPGDLIIVPESFL